MAPTSTDSTSENLSNENMQHALRSQFVKSLSEFMSSPSVFRVIHTIDSRNKPGLSSTTTSVNKTLYVLDSSFNPPSKAHQVIAMNAVLRDSSPKPARVMLLLATTNADKAAKPAAFEDRLVMMSIMAQNLRKELYDSGRAEEVPVDIAVTKKPYFMDKAASIDESKLYAEDMQQVHLAGYDTLVRIFNSKYYPEDKKLSVLQPFLSRHRLRVCYREDGEVGKEQQRKYVEGIGDGSRKDEGMREEWAEMVEMVDDAREVKGISSTRAREACQEQKLDRLKSLVGDDMARYVIEHRLYEDAEEQ